jgi:hypothetical protein
VIEPVEQFLAELLRHATPGYNFQVRFYLLEAAQASEKRVDFVFRLFAHRAGIEKDNVGLADVTYRHISQRAKQPLDPQRIIFVHLTAEGSNV